MPDHLRRVAALTLVAVLGIGLQAAAIALADESTDAPETPALIDAAKAPSVIAARSSLSEREILAAAAPRGLVPVEKLDTDALPRAASAGMEATLVVEATPPPTPAPTAAPAAPAAAVVAPPPAVIAAPPPPPPAPVAPPPPAAPPPPIAPFVVDEATWDRLAQCESSGNWSINTGNGYYGGLQFDLSTWQAYGGGAYAAYPHQATREQQIATAERLYAARGFQPWPGCRALLGLP